MIILRPCYSSRVTQKFGENKNPYYAQHNMLGHNGVDYGAYYEDCRQPVTIMGVVRTADFHPTYGNRVIVQYKDNNKYYKMYFGHLKSIAVKVGDYVDTGALLGITGATGTACTGAHLHKGWYECQQNGTVLNQNNGYGGAIDDSMWYIDMYVSDFLKKQNQAVGILQKLVDLVKQLLGKKNK